MDAIIEGLLYVQGDIGLTIKDIMNILNIDEETAKREVLNLKNYYDDNKRGLRINFLGNTIKLTIFSRRGEIEIMRLVGASNITIKLPFLFEGFIIGVVGSIIPICITIYGYVILYSRMHGKLFSNMIMLIKPYPFVFKISLILLGIGALVGMYGSIKAVRKYLKV